MAGKGDNGGGEYTRIADGYLEIRQKLTAGHRSSTGKSMVLVTSGGFKPTDNDPVVKVNLTAIKKS